MNNIKRIFLGMFAFIALGGFEYAHAAEQTAETVVKEELVKAVIGEALSETAQVAFGAVNCISLAAETYQIGKGVKSYLSPSEEEQAKALETEQKLRLLELRKELKVCLLKNDTRSKHGPSGIPCVCEETAETLSMMGGRTEVERMSRIYRQFNQ